tara:strand:- start:22355 stop:23368 length:1014 start_codon:yes stop_codon:yes gene_type:complete
LKEIIKKIIYTVGSTKLAKNFVSPWRGRAAILCYHRVLPDNNLMNKNPQQNQIISESLFDEQMSYLSSNHIVVSMDEMIEHLKSKSDKFVVALTFDDGYKDNLTNALPILEKYNLPATIYISTRFPEGDCEMWWYELWELISLNNNIIINWGGSIKKMKTINYSQKIIAYNIIGNLFVEENYIKQTELMSKIRENNSPISYDSLCLKWEEIIKLSNNPLITIGSHAHTHCSLRHLSKEDVFWELSYSKKIIEDKINKKVKHFAFPFGTNNEVSKRDQLIAQQCGYRTAAITIPKVLYDNNLLFSLPRLSVRNTNSFVINAKLYGLDNFIYSFKKSDL